MSHGAFESLNRGHFEKIVTSAVLLGRTALTPENLVADFCGNRDVAGELARALFSALGNGQITPRSRMLFAEWRSLFHLAHDDVSKQRSIRERKRALGEIFGISIADGDNETEYRALYALQTSYAIIVKSIALNVLAAIRDHGDLIRFKSQAESSSESIRGKLAKIEDGDLLRSLGFTNLLEGDFFAWYCTPEQWRPDTVGEAVRKVFAVLAGYKEQPFLNATETAIDFFKDLYAAIMPGEVRHSLGEYYTPAWLADLVAGRALELRGAGDGWRGLDPCCGSGTIVTTMLRRKLASTVGMPRRERLAAILASVVGMDLNPLAVLTARINYFINVSSLLDEEDEIEIPVYLGDASYVPERVMIGRVECFRYEVSTTLRNATVDGPGFTKLDVAVPTSALRDIPRFGAAMACVERHIKALDEDAIVSEMAAVCDPADRTAAVVEALRHLAGQFVDLERKKWNGIWARIVTDFLTTAALGKFDVVVGNPPWIDWRNLPSNYRDRVKGLCVDRNLFSGDGVTGGINLNVCALITNVSAGNWLAHDGILGFIMPDSLLVQSTYRGFRELRTAGGGRMAFRELHDWSAGGKPFAPVGQNFYVYFIGNGGEEGRTVPVRRYVKRDNDAKAQPPVRPLRAYRRVTDFGDIAHVFDVGAAVALPIRGSPRGGYLIRTHDAAALPEGIAGEAAYTSRQGIEFLPKTLFMLKFGKTGRNGRATFSTFGNVTDQHVLETEFMYPMIQGSRIRRFSPPDPLFYVPFPYDEGQRSPIASAPSNARHSLSRRAPKLAEYLGRAATTIEKQSDHNRKISGKHGTEFYALSRVGAYTYAKHFVAFRDNTAWAACVVSELETPWGERKRPLFQKHAVTVS